jgi:hypothetical protein
MICHATDLQSVHLVFARDTAEISEETFANRLYQKYLTILRAEDDMIMQGRVGVRHRFQPSLRDALCCYHTLAINRQATIRLPLTRLFGDNAPQTFASTHAATVACECTAPKRRSGQLVPPGRL